MLRNSEDDVNPSIVNGRMGQNLPNLIDERTGIRIRILSFDRPMF